jgi:hypothetical protein
MLKQVQHDVSYDLKAFSVSCEAAFRRKPCDRMLDGSPALAQEAIDDDGCG